MSVRHLESGGKVRPSSVELLLRRTSDRRTQVRELQAAALLPVPGVSGVDAARVEALFMALSSKAGTSGEVKAAVTEQLPELVSAIVPPAPARTQRRRRKAGGRVCPVITVPSGRDSFYCRTCVS